MQVTETFTKGLKRGFSVVIPHRDIAEKCEQKLQALTKTVKLPGFRPGKIPLSVVRSRYGEAVRFEVSEESVEQAIEQIIKERQFRTVGRAGADIVPTPQGHDLTFTFEIELMPEITVPDFSKISLTRYSTTVTDKEVQEGLQRVAEANRDLEKVEEKRGGKKNEILKVDFVGTIDGEPFEGGSAKDVMIEIAGPGYISGFTEQMEGMKVGETKIIGVTFPADYGHAPLAGKKASFEVKVKGLHRAVPAKIDDALAQKFGLKDLAELTELVKGQVQAEYTQLGRLKLKRDLLDALAPQAVFETPETLLNSEFQAIWQRVSAEMKAGTLQEADKGKSEEALQAEYRTIAERRVRLGLLLSEVGSTEKVVVTDEELFLAAQNEAMRYPGREENVMQFFQKNPEAVNRLRGPIFEDKVVDLIVLKTKITDKEVSFEELKKLATELTDEEKEELSGVVQGNTEKPRAAAKEKPAKKTITAKDQEKAEEKPAEKKAKKAAPSEKTAEKPVASAEAKPKAKPAAKSAAAEKAAKEPEKKEKGSKASAKTKSASK